MTGRQVAIAEWVLAGIVLLWFVLFLLVGDAPRPRRSRSVSPSPRSSSHLGLALSLGINGLVHFRRPDRLRDLRARDARHRVLVIVLLVLASVYDQTHYGATYRHRLGFGHWFEWFLPLVVAARPVALTVVILGSVKYKPVAASSLRRARSARSVRLGDRDGVLEVRAARPVGRAQRPAVDDRCRSRRCRA